MKSPPRCVEVHKGLSHPSRGAWIEILAVGAEIIRAKSHPSRGAWIEIAG